MLGIMLLREFPGAVRRRPSQGDRGVDVYVPFGDGVAVYQVKSFVGSLTSSHKRQIAKSRRRVIEEPDVNGRPVRQWFCFRPENPTAEDEEWLAAAMPPALFPCGWKGLDLCDSLAAKYPDVVDYYLFDGKERLQQVVEQYLRLVGLGTPHPATTEPADAVGSLAAAHKALNAFDPHYRYDFEVRATTPAGPPQDQQRAFAIGGGLVASITRSDGESAVTFHVFARYPQATDDRPIPGKLKLNRSTDEPIEDGFQDFVRYGIGPAQFEGVSFEADLPGGLGGTFTNAAVRVGPARSTSPVTEMELVVSRPDRSPIAQGHLTVTPTVGLDGSGSALHGVDVGGTFELWLRVDRHEGRAKLQVRPSESLTGLLARRAMPGLRIMAALKPPNLVTLRLPDGPALFADAPVPEEFGDLETPTLVIAAVEALAAIQRYTVEEVRIPDLDTTPIVMLDHWQQAVAVLEGSEVQQPFPGASLQLEETEPTPSLDEASLLMTASARFGVMVGDQNIELCDVTMRMPPSKVIVEDDRLRIVATPGAMMNVQRTDSAAAERD